MELLYAITDVNFNLPATLVIYIFMFLLISTLILIIQIKPILSKLYTKTPFYWFIGLIVLNIINIIFTLVHYNSKSGTFIGEAGDRGNKGDIGTVGDYSKCTRCDEKIVLDVHKRYDVLHNIYVNGELGEVRRPYVRFGFSSLGDMIVTKTDIRKTNLKQSYVVSGSMPKVPEDFMLMARIPPIKNHTKKPTYIWRAIPPTDYVAMGDIITNTSGKPPKSAISCIPQSCVKTVNIGDGYTSSRFFYQNMRPGKEKEYIFISFWDTPLNTFYTNFPGFGNMGQPTFFNQSLYYNIVSGNLTYIRYDKVNNIYVPIENKKNNIIQKFQKIISPVDLNRKRQNLGELGYFIMDEIKAITLWQAIEHYFPGNFKYQISINDIGDGLGGKRLNNIQKKIIKYAQAWIIPNMPIYVIHNKCLMKNRIDHEKKELILKIKSLYADFAYILRKYGQSKSDLLEYLSSHTDRLIKQMRHIPNFSTNIKDEDFNHFSVNRLKYLHKELKNLHISTLKFTNEIPEERRNKYFDLIKALKQYDEAKLNYDINLDNERCVHNNESMKETKKVFTKTWDQIHSLFLTDRNFKVKLKNKDFDTIPDNKLDKLTHLLNVISDKLIKYVDNVCK